MTRELHTLESELTPDELRLLLSCVRRRNLKGAHLEIGTAAGGTLKQLMLSYPGNQRPRFVSVDTMKYYHDQYAVIRRNLTASDIDPDTVDFRQKKSSGALRESKRKGETFSFIFIDASHKLSHVTEDIGWASMLTPGGLLCFHDYSPHHPGVVSAVKRFLAKCPEYIVAGRVGSLLVLEKTRISANAEVTSADRIRAHLISFLGQITRSLQKRAKVISGDT